MCGIAGYFGSKEVDLTLAAVAMHHRGPDMQGVASGSGWKIAFNRLSIIDISRERHAAILVRRWVVLNGEIY